MTSWTKLPGSAAIGVIGAEQLSGRDTGLMTDGGYALVGMAASFAHDLLREHGAVLAGGAGAFHSVQQSSLSTNHGR